MNYQEYICKASQDSADAAFRNAKAVPADKLEWSPMNEGRTVLDICRELAQCPLWAEMLISGREMPEWNEETMAANKAEREQWKTAEACQAECDRRLEAFYAVVRATSEEDLKKTKWLPYDGGRDFTFAEMMNYPRWNFDYHVGQIAYVQTLYGDKEMH